MSERPLLRLARLCGVVTEHRDGFRELSRPSAQTLLAVLDALGVRLSSPEAAAAEVRRRRQARWGSLLEPVTVCWQGRPPTAGIRVPARLAGRSIEFALQLENGTERAWSASCADLRPVREAAVSGRRFAACRLPLPGPLPPGYHQLEARLGRLRRRSLVISAPERAAPLERTWGVFAPLHALHDRRSPGAATFSDLSRLIRWVQGLGGGLVGTLPLLAAFLDEPFAPSPYTPVSRRYWNELWVDLSLAPEAESQTGGAGSSPAARHLDYRAAMQARRGALERAAAGLRGERLKRFREHVAARDDLRRYAAFRAGVERGLSGPAVFDLADPRCLHHAYSQWLAAGQLADLAREARRRGPGLYLDLPLGVHPQGYDAFAHAGQFAKGVSGGAPPDRFFSAGQDWGFRPVHPARSREDRHEYFIRSLRHHLRHAGVLRIDHVMGLHRMYWIPDGAGGDQGAYVQYPADEFYAIACLESRRHGAALVGEDLGTVPARVRRRMARRGLRRSYVAQFEFRADPSAAVRAPPTGSVASVNTHDTATFAAFWEGADIDDQVALGLLAPEHAAAARRRRAALRRALRDFTGAREAGPVLAACLGELAASRSECVIVALEDLWGETEPQNTPGTDRERPNWTRRMRPDLEEILADPAVRRALARVDRARRAPSRSEACNAPPHRPS